jgi:hypothetical protein
MARLTEEAVELLCDNFMKLIDVVTGPDQMSIEEAIESWEDIEVTVREALQSRMDAARTDLEQEGT